MMTQEEFMDVKAMKRQGLSIKEIAEETGYHPSTISNWLKNGGPTEKRSSVVPAVIDERWSARIAEIGAVRYPAAVGHQRVRAHCGPGVCRLLCQRGPAAPPVRDGAG